MARFMNQAEIAEIAAGPFSKSSFSNQAPDCVEIAPTQNGDVLVRNSNDPEKKTFLVTSGGWSQFLGDIKAGKYDDLL